MTVAPTYPLLLRTLSPDGVINMNLVAGVFIEHDGPEDSAAVFAYSATALTDTISSESNHRALLFQGTRAECDRYMERHFNLPPPSAPEPTSPP